MKSFTGLDGILSVEFDPEDESIHGVAQVNLILIGQKISLSTDGMYRDGADVEQVKFKTGVKGLETLIVGLEQMRDELIEFEEHTVFERPKVD